MLCVKSQPVNASDCLDIFVFCHRSSHTVSTSHLCILFAVAVNSLVTQLAKVLNVMWYTTFELILLMVFGFVSVKYNNSHNNHVMAIIQVNLH